MELAIFRTFWMLFLSLDQSLPRPSTSCFLYPFYHSSRQRWMRVFSATTPTLYWQSHCPEPMQTWQHLYKLKRNPRIALVCGLLLKLWLSLVTKQEGESAGACADFLHQLVPRWPLWCPLWCPGCCGWPSSSPGRLDSLTDLLWTSVSRSLVCKDHLFWN